MLNRISSRGSGLKRHWQIILLSICVAFPIFVNLGVRYLWADEGDTAVLALNILKFGIPKAWDGVTFTDSDFGARLNKDLVMVSHPWLQYYVAAGSFALFGESTFAARLPFAIFGWLSIPLLYFLLWKITSRKSVALTACIIVCLSVQFLLYSRQCRQYSLNIFLTLVLLLAFFKLDRKWSFIWFSLLSILVFHCHPSGIVVIFTLLILTLIYPPFKIYSRGLIKSLPITLALTIPWFYFASSGYEENTALIQDWTKFIPRLGQFLIECASIISVVGWLILAVLIYIVRRPQANGGKIHSNKKNKLHHSNASKPPISSTERVLNLEERNLLILCSGLLVAYSLLIALTQSRNAIWLFGLRHVPAVIPLGAAITALLISKFCGNNWRLWILVLPVFCFTNLTRITPWSFLSKETVNFDYSQSVSLHVAQGWVNKLFRTQLIGFARKFWHKNPGSVEEICKFLNTHAKKDDIILTNYDWEPIYFHTRLPQALKIMSEYPIYQTAKDHGLPDYVFEVKGTKWIICRWPWMGYRGYDFNMIFDELDRLGVTLELAAELPESVWENRENIHFHRFPVTGHIYPFFSDVNKISIFKVNWKNE